MAAGRGGGSGYLGPGHDEGSPILIEKIESGLYLTHSRYFVTAVIYNVKMN